MADPENESYNENYERMPPNEVGFVFIGPSGTGKSTLRDYICTHGDGENSYVKYLPLTTRQKRPDENGEYRFVSHDEMERAKTRRDVIFGNQSYDNEFLTLWPHRLPEKMRYIYIYLPEAAAKLKDTFPETKIIQIRPATTGELRGRILSRDPNILDAELIKRTDAAEEELKCGAEIADAIIVNDGSIEDIGARMQEILRS